MRVLEYNKTLNYSELIKNNILPNLEIYCNNKHFDYPKKFPIWVHLNNYYSAFGLYIEFMVRKFIQEVQPNADFGFNNEENNQEWCQKFSNKNVKWSDIARETLQLCCELQITNEMWKQTLSVLEYIEDSVKEFFKSSKDHIRFGVEYTYETIQGHPDIVTSSMILDVKTTLNFRQMMDASFLQILSYLTLARANGENPSHIGILLPLQKSILLIETKDIDTTMFLVMMTDPSQKHVPNIEKDIDPLYYTGWHLCKSKTILNTISLYISKYQEYLPACQMFLRGTRGGNSSLKVKEMKELQTLIHNSGLRFYTHTPYVVNLSNPYTKKTPTCDKWIVEMVQDDLKKTKDIGGKGVVVHVGKYLKSTKEKALDMMESTIRKILCEASSECPLLLETPAGSGTELCTNYEDFYNFAQRFKGDDRFGVCIDTCHVFAAGEDPLEYVNKWLIDSPHTLKLLHFNDSMKKFGTCVDRHAPIGQGFIGMNKLRKIANLAHSYGISMVIE